MGEIKITSDNIKWEKVGLDEYSVSKGNYADVNTIKKEYWGNEGNKLEAVPVEVNGDTVYRIDEIDKDGNRTGMGFVDKEGLTNKKSYEGLDSESMRAEQRTIRKANSHEQHANTTNGTENGYPSSKEGTPTTKTDDNSVIPITRDDIDWNKTASDEYSVASGNYEDSSMRTPEYFGDNGTTLEAVPVEVNGKTVYRIDEIDQNGNRSTMIFVDKEGLVNKKTYEGLDSESMRAEQRSIRTANSHKATTDTTNGRDKGYPSSMDRYDPTADNNPTDEILKREKDFLSFYEKETSDTNQKPNTHGYEREEKAFQATSNQPKNNSNATIERIPTANKEIEDNFANFYKSVEEQENNNIPTIEPDEIYVVKEGEHLVDIANKYGIDYYELAKYNKMYTPDKINAKPGTMISIPNATNLEAWRKKNAPNGRDKGYPSSMDGIKQQTTSTSTKENISKTNTHGYEREEKAFQANWEASQKNNNGSVREGEIYIAQIGDNMYKIARKYNIDPQALIAANPKIENPDKINIGDEINIPGVISNKQTQSSFKDKVTNKKAIDLTKVKKGTNVSEAINKYSQEIENAEYATVSENLFTTTTTDYIHGEPVIVTHVVINNPNQINGAPANGSYGNGLEKSSAAANRLNSSILINGSHFNYNDGTEDLSGANDIVIVNGVVKHDGVSGGNELLLDDKGNIFNVSGKSAQQLVNEGVKYSFSCHSTQVIVNGDTSPSEAEKNLYRRTVIGQSAPGEFYIITDTTENNKLSDTAEYLKSKGVINAYSLDQGGSVTLIRNNDLINKPSDDAGERAVGDFLYFTE